MRMSAPPMAWPGTLDFLEEAIRAEPPRAAWAPRNSFRGPKGTFLLGTTMGPGDVCASEKVVRLAQTTQVGPCIPVKIQL